MKTFFLLFTLILSYSVVLAQTNTNLGTDAGNTGTGATTSVGYKAGDLATGGDNSFFGYYSGKSFSGKYAVFMDSWRRDG